MAQTGDVAARLDEGEPAVETFAEFVWACGVLGYRHPDLTANLGQLHDWYAAEDGLDLRALDADSTALAAAAGSAEQALRLQDDQLTALAQAWQGHGAAAAREFLLRHGGAAQQAVVAVRRAADTVAALREQLWQAVDTKVAVTERIEARCAAQREAWLAAARTVRTGLGDRDAASELIDAHVKPFVDNDIGVDWVSAMRSATAAVADAYAGAIAALTNGPAPVFEIPGDLGPSWTPRTGTTIPPDPSVGRVGTVPAGFVPSGPSDPVPWTTPVSPVGMPPPEPQIPSAAPHLATPTAEAEAPAPGPAASDPAAAWGSPLGGGVPGTGLSGIGSGLSGIGQQLADLFGGLIGSTADGASGLATDTALPGEPDEPDVADLAGDEDNAGDSDEEDEPDSAGDENAEDVAGEDDNATDTPADDMATDEGTAEVTVPVETPVEPVDPQPAPPTVVPPVAAPEPVSAPAGKTPCEIAADELPQVGG